MTYHYSLNYEAVGPITTEQLRELHEKGVINNETPILPEGVTQWVPYRAVFPIPDRSPSLAASSLPPPLPPPPSPMAAITIARNGNSLGNFSAEAAREGLRSGRFLLTDLGWREGMRSWQPLSHFPEFAADVPASAPTPPPTAPPAKSIITPAPVGSTSSTAAPRRGLPWDERRQSGFIKAFFKTLVMVLTKPGAAFTAMKREGGLVDPLIYALVGGTFGLIVDFLFIFLMPSLASFGGRENPLGHVLDAGIGSLFLIILVPLVTLFIVIGAFLSAAILHVCLMIVGGAKQSFETTFRVVCFSMGSVDPLLIVPFCGGLIIAGVWTIVLNCIGLARAHEIGTGRAVLAVFLPVAYAVVSWLLIQIATQVFPFLEIPNWVTRVVIILLLLGFPVALLLSWAFDWSSKR